MKHMIAVLFLLLMLCSVSTPASRVVCRIPDPTKYPTVLADEKQFYVFDHSQKKAFIYNRKNGAKVAEFLKFGAGPGEIFTFKYPILTRDTIIINSYPKYVVYSKSGKFLHEKRCPIDAGNFVPVGKNFVGTSYPPSSPIDKTVQVLYSLYNPGFKKIKDIYRDKFPSPIRHDGKKYHNLWYRDSSKALSYKDRVYIGATSQGFYFAVFDSEGNKLYEIKKNLPKRKVTAEEKKRILNRPKSNNQQMRYIESHTIYEFPEYYPAYEDFFIDSDKIYVFHNRQDDIHPITIMDLKGNILKEKKIPVIQIMGIRPVFKGKIYNVLENEDTEEFEIHETDID